MVLPLLAVLLMAVLGACAARSTPPGPNTAAGVAGQAGYELLHWEEGLGLLIWHDVLGSCMSSATGSAAETVYEVHGSCESPDGRRISWDVQTTGGRRAQLQIVGAVSEISGDTVVLVSTKGKDVRVRQLRRDLSALRANRETIVEFAGRYPDMAGFIEGTASP